MASPLLNATTARIIQQFSADLPHAITLSGPEGVGLMTIAQLLVANKKSETLVVLPERQEVVDIEKGTITVDVIRRLYEQTRTVTDGRVIIVDYADRMGHAAQNAFLKLLEEPTENTHFILLVHDNSTLLPTICSRVAVIEVLPVTRKQSEELLDGLKVSDASKRAQLLFLAEGLPAALTRLASDDEYFAKRAGIVRDARQFVMGTDYDRLKIAQNYKDSRENALLLVSDALRQLRMTLGSNPDRAILRSIDSLLVVHERLSMNGNIRLQLATAL